ncbi:MAG: hypothetical protein HY904_17350 [Deltaproteobacteria bacterium]|nr:hypothetical protein [Deltaproteobacteria bacterium]
MLTRARLAAAALLLAQGCASGARQPATRAPSAQAAQQAQRLFRVTSLGASPEDEVVVHLSAMEAVEVAQRWGGLRVPVNLRIHPTHQGLEEASRQSNVPWMRGWARFDEVELEAPSRWGGDRAPQNVTELLSHELTHVVMYQRIGERDTWMHVQIPLWFREGMASVTSRQGYRRMTGEQLGTWLRQHPSDDPWLQADALAHGAQPVVYGAAHRAFERLLAAHGDEGVGRVLDGLRAELGFDRAFADGVGVEPQAFLANFRRELEVAAGAGARGPAVAARVPGQQG